MASSNRHWPSMFRSNPAACDFQQHQPTDMNSSSGGKSSLISSGISQESTRSTEAKPRWNPRPEQIRILEGIFNAGMVNPPRDEIRRICLQLQEYGQVGDANVFYWFQNRKSRTKNKLRAAAAGHLQPPAAGRGAAALQARACASSSPPQAVAVAAPAPPVTPPRHLLASPLAPTSSSSSSSDRSSGSCKSVMKPPAALESAAAATQGMQLAPSAAIDLFSPTPSPSPVLSAFQLYYHSHPMPTPTAPVRELLLTSPEPPPPFFPQWPQNQYLPATELGGILGSSHAHTTPAILPAASPGLLLGLCNDALGQQDLIDAMSCSKGLGQFLNTTTTSCTAGDQLSHKTDAVSAVIREDETARLGLVHYSFGAATAAAAAAAPVHAAAADVSTAILPCAAPSNAAATSTALLTDQLQGLLDAGLIGVPAPPTATVVVAVAARPDGVQYYTMPAMMHLDVKLFGEAAVLLRHTGEPVLVDESGVTVEPLQQGGVYYVLVSN